jgi:hypothetical protein
VETRSNMAAAKFRAPSNYDLKMLFIVWKKSLQINLILIAT